VATGGSRLVSAGDFEIPRGAFDLDELERLFDEFQQSLPEGFEFRGELPELDAIPGLDELPFDGPEFEE